MSGPAMVDGVVMTAWKGLLRANCILMRELDTELRSTHGLTISDYDVLVQLREAEDSSLRMSDLSRRTMLTRSGMTRLVQGLERDGFVERRACGEDARVSYAVLTPGGRERLEAARATHHAGIRRMFADHFDESAAAQLAQLLDRIPGVAFENAAAGAPGPPCD